MPRLLTQEELQQISLDLALTESAPTKLNSKMLALASGRKGKVPIDQFFNLQRFADRSRQSGTNLVGAGTPT